MSIIPMVKVVSSLVVSTGVATIVTSAAKLVVPPVGAKALRRIATKASVVVGAAVLSGMVSDQAVKYADEKIDEAAEAVKNATDMVEAALGETS